MTRSFVESGSVLVWGESACGALGLEVHAGVRIPSYPKRSTPTQVEGLPHPAGFVAAGGTTTWAILADGSLWWWGSLGDGAPLTNFAPVPAYPMLDLPSPMTDIQVVRTFHTTVLIATGAQFSVSCRASLDPWTGSFVE